MVLDGRTRTVSDDNFQNVLDKTGLDSIFSDEDCTRTEKFNSPLMSDQNTIIKLWYLNFLKFCDLMNMKLICDIWCYDVILSSCCIRLTSWFESQKCMNKPEVEPEREYRVDSGRILRFSFRPGSGPGVKNLGKTGHGPGVTFQFLCDHILSKNMGKLRLDWWLYPESEQESDSQIWKIAGPGSRPDSKILELERSRSLKKWFRPPLE